MTNVKLPSYIAALVSLMIVACSDTGDQVAVESAKGDLATPTYQRWYKFQQVTSGAGVFRQNCAACHGNQAQGAENWRKTDAKGKYPPPPLNSTGHGWHHPLPILFSVIKNGSPGGQGDMPAWREKLTDEQILDAIAWFQSKWPEEIYQAWAQRDAAARKGG